MFVKLGESTYLNADRIKMVSIRDSYTRVTFDDGTSRDINGAWEENLVNWLDRITILPDGGASSDENSNQVNQDSKRSVDSILDTKIADFFDQCWKPKVRTLNFLVRNFETFRDMYRKDDRYSLLCYRGIGRVTLADLNDNLVNIGLPRLKH